MICLRCGHPHTAEEWDELWWDHKLAFARKHGFNERKAFDAAHHEMEKHGPRPKEPKPPLWMRLGARTLGGEEMVNTLKKIWGWFNGKKTLISSILVGVPVIWETVQVILRTGGVEEATLVGITGSIGLIVGWGHKLVKTFG